MVGQKLTLVAWLVIAVTLQCALGQIPTCEHQEWGQHQTCS